VPRRKTNVKDAEWLADLLCHRLVRGSFFRPQPQRDLRALTRHRTNLVRDRATVVNRLHIVGASVREMLTTLVGGQSDVAVLAEMARGRMRAKHTELERALSGQVRDHHRFLIAGHLEQIDFLDAQIAGFDAQIIQSVAQQAPVAPPANPPEATPLPDSSTTVEGALSWEAAI
jgi:transposase